MLTCDCNRSCPNVLSVVSSAVSGENFILSTNSTITPQNGARYLLKIPVSVLPTAALTTVNQIFVSVDGVNIPLQCVIGNNVYTDQLKCLCANNCGNIILRLIYGSTPSHFKILSHHLCPSSAYGLTATTASVNSASTGTKAALTKKTAEE